MKITVPEGFIKHREEKSQQYNQRGRTDRKFFMDLDAEILEWHLLDTCLLYTSPSPRDRQKSRMPSSA